MRGTKAKRLRQFAFGMEKGYLKDGGTVKLKPGSWRFMYQKLKREGK